MPNGRGVATGNGYRHRDCRRTVTMNWQKMSRTVGKFDPAHAIDPPPDVPNLLDQEGAQALPKLAATRLVIGIHCQMPDREDIRQHPLVQNDAHWPLLVRSGIYGKKTLHGNEGNANPDSPLPFDNVRDARFLNCRSNFPGEVRLVGIEEEQGFDSVPCM
jgi:hypothetical protein